MILLYCYNLNEDNAQSKNLDEYILFYRINSWYELCNKNTRTVTLKIYICKFNQKLKFYSNFIGINFVKKRINSLKFYLKRPSHKKCDQRPRKEFKSTLGNCWWVEPIEECCNLKAQASWLQEQKLVQVLIGWMVEPLTKNRCQVYNKRPNWNSKTVQ